MIAITGHSASGKDTILNIMVKLGFKPIVSYTTRSPRHYEKEGQDYRFISFDDFQQRKADGFFAETTYYNNNHYGIAREDCQDDRCCVVEPFGLENLQDQYDNITVIFVKASEEVRHERLIKRGDHPTEIIRRITSDRDLFAGMEEKADVVFDNNENGLDKLPMKVEQLVKILKSGDENGQTKNPMGLSNGKGLYRQGE